MNVNVNVNEQQLLKMASKHSSGLPLPKDFEEKVTDKGKKFYINHKEQTTTWVDPRDAMTKKTCWAECEADEMPYGWELCVETQHDLQYWIDHNNQRNTVDDPRNAENRKEQEEFLKQRVGELKKSMGRNRLTLRKSMKKLDFAKEAYENVKEEDDPEAAADARMEYRRRLSIANDVRRVVEEGEAKIEALEKIKFDEMDIAKASEVKNELKTLNENYEKELEEKEQIKAELQELKDLVATYMTSMSKEGKTDQVDVKKGTVPAEDSQKVAGAKEIEKISELKIAEPAQHMTSSVEMKIELEQRKLERERQLKETEELKKAKREMRILREKIAANSSESALPFHNIEEEDLPDWLFSSHVVKLLDIKGDHYDNDKDLQVEIKAKVKHNMDKQKADVDSMSFKSKLAFFTTLEIHDDVQRRPSDKKERGSIIAIKNATLEKMNSI